MRYVNGTTALLLLAIALAPATSARADDEETRHEIVWEGGTPLEEVLATVRDVAGVPLVWNPKARALVGQVVTDLRLAGDREEILSGLRSLLTFYDMAVIPVGDGANAKILVADARATGALLRLKATYVELDEANVDFYEQQDGLYVTTTIRMPHMESLRDARNALSRLVTMQNIGSVQEVPDARAFVVSDFAPNVAAIYRLLRRMDENARLGGSAEETATFQAVVLKHARAVEAADLLTAHFARPPAVPALPQQPAPPVAFETLRIHADERTNQVLVSGPVAEVERVLAVLRVLDVPVEGSGVWAHVIGLEHASAHTAANALMNLVRTSPGLWAAGPRGAAPAIVAHAETNSLLVSATPAAFEQLRRIVAELDVPGLEED